MRRLLFLMMVTGALMGAVLFAQPASAQQTASDPFVVQGSITEINDNSVLVEEDPSDPIEPTPPETDKGYFNVTEETEILRRQGDESVSATFEELSVGQLVEATYAGPVGASYPSVGDAESIVILEEAGSEPDEEQATLSFEVVTEGEVPEDTIFRAAGGSPDGALSAIGLTDPDGDGTYTGSVDLATGEYRVLIEQGTSGEPGRTTIWGPEIIILNEDTTISTSVDFGSEPNGEQPQEEQPQCFLPEGCFLSGDGSDEKIVGGIGPDYIIGGGGDDALHGLDNDDWLDGGAGNDLVRGGDGDDLVDGGSGDDLVRGNDGNDYVSGFTGSDILEAGGGSDFIYAADGEFDEVSGGPGHDVCVVDEDDDVSGCEEVYTG